MSHDIRTPINGICGMVNMADHYADDMEKQTEYRTKVKEASHLLLELVNDVLDMSKLESGEVILEEIPFDSDKKYMVTLHKDQSQVCAYIKGACDYLLEVCSFWWIGGKIEPLGHLYTPPSQYIFNNSY